MKFDIHIHASGGRFDSLNGYPASALATLAAWDGLVRSIAEDLYRAAHPEQNSVPSELATGLHVAITRLEGGGSADGVVACSFAEGSAFFDVYAEAANAASNLIARVVGPELDQPFEWSKATANQLVAIQDGLGEDEALAVTLPSSHAPRTFQLTRATCKRARGLTARVGLTTTGQAEFFGYVDGIGRDPGMMRLRQGGTGRRMTFACEAGPWEAAMSAFLDRAAVRVAATQADGSRRRSAREVSTITRLAGPDVESRLAELSTLKRGWSGEDEESMPPDRSVLRRVRAAVWTIVAEHGERVPHLFPTLEGGIEAMWRDESETRALIFQRDDAAILPLRILRSEKRSIKGQPARSVAAAMTWLKSQAVE